MKIINNNWEYAEKWTEDFLHGKQKGEMVRLPHNVELMPVHEEDPESYQKICGYRRQLDFSGMDPAKRYFLQFDGAAHIATVYFNGQKMLEHRNGYTGFRTEITKLIQWEGKNEVAVKLDSTENPAIPPFGYVIDYLTYGGIYRNVYLDERPQAMIKDVFLTTPDLHTLKIQTWFDGLKGNEQIKITIRKDGSKLLEKSGPVQSEYCLMLEDAEPWSPEHPVLYDCIVELIGDETDLFEHRFGFRTVATDENSILLNGKPYFIYGLNRHQCYPYSGYAVPDALQKEDARILKQELGVNAVRTSHYPQSHAFLDACDELGLLVFTEIPGWQHIGDHAWKQQAIENTSEMVQQYRNHTSIIIWGVRINESLDDDELYRAANAMAHALDPSRPTSGVRYIEKSSLLEDIYGYNDFSHDGKTPGCKAKKDVTKDRKPLLITEANGHMYPTKSFDRWERRQEHALRHARVLNAARADGEHAGCFQWCMFDYPTHKDFGSGDRICYHGVMDFFRNPKLAASVYASQSDDHPVLEIGSTMDIGDYDGGHLDEIDVFTNCDEVRLYKNGDFVKTFTSEGWSGLKHGPVRIDDTIGELLKTKEGLTGRQEEYVHDALLAAQKYGLASLPKKAVAELAWCMLHYKMKYADGVDLYGKYVGGWGGGSTSWRFDGVKDGKTVISVTKTPSTKLHLEIRPSHTVLHEGDVYDMASFRIRLLDEYNNLVSYAQLPLSIDVKGPLEIVGPSLIALEGGMGGTYVRTTGMTGEAEIRFSASGIKDETIQLIIK